MDGKKNLDNTEQICFQRISWKALLVVDEKKLHKYKILLNWITF